MAGKKTHQDYFAEGQEAHREGMDKTSNPYTETNAEAQWDSGWDAEQEAAYGEDS